MDVPSPVILRYLNRRVIEVANCQTDFNNKNFESSLKMGHQLKGNGTTFGFPELSKLGQKLEEAAMNGDEKGMETALSEISIWINEKLSSGSFL